MTAETGPGEDTEALLVGPDEQGDDQTRGDTVDDGRSPSIPLPVDDPAAEPPSETDALDDPGSDAGHDSAAEPQVAVDDSAAPARPRPRPGGPRGQEARQQEHHPEPADGDHPWGRVDEQGNVFVFDRAAWRKVGEYPAAPADEALAYYERKFAELAGTVGLLEQRAHRGAAPADVAGAVERMVKTLTAAKAVGDLESLRVRVTALGGEVVDLSAQKAEEQRARVGVARAEREAIVVAAEGLAARDPATVQWKSTTTALNDLFARWQESQHGVVKLPKSESNALWTRFRTARSTVESQRRAFFAEQDATQKVAREAKEQLVERAEALATGSGDTINTYRRLLDEWKGSGRAGKKVDDALWARFKAAGDVLYSARNAAHQAQDDELGANLDVKLALLDEAEPLLKARDAAGARTTLTGIQRRWDAAGKVPRDRVRVVEDRMRKVEQAVKSLEQDHWRRTNPETRARSEGLADQLNAAIGKLEAELAEANAAGDRRRIREAEEALAARRVWLGAVRS